MLNETFHLFQVSPVGGSGFCFQAGWSRRASGETNRLTTDAGSDDTCARDGNAEREAGLEFLEAHAYE